MPVYQVALVKITNRTPGFAECLKTSADLLAKYGAGVLDIGPHNEAPK